MRSAFRVTAQLIALGVVLQASFVALGWFILALLLGAAAQSVAVGLPRLDDVVLERLHLDAHLAVGAEQHAQQQRVDRAGAQAIAVARQLLDHPLAVDLAFGSVVQDVQPDQAREALRSGLAAFPSDAATQQRLRTAAQELGVSAGALSQQNAEALVGLMLTQIVRPGSPFVYGSFTSNVDMKSGAPAFGFSPRWR